MSNAFMIQIFWQGILRIILGFKLKYLLEENLKQDTDSLKKQKLPKKLDINDFINEN